MITASDTSDTDSTLSSEGSITLPSNSVTPGVHSFVVLGHNIYPQTHRTPPLPHRPSNIPRTKSPDMLRAEDVKEEFLLCSICTREFDEDSHVPRILPCLHTFCQQCLKKICKNSRVGCPLCKSEHILARDGIYGFPKDTTRRNLIDFIKVRRRSSDIVCKDCPEEQTASDFCKECYIFMCPDCTKAHKRSYASRKHGILTIAELQNSGIDVFRRKLTCTKQGHEGQQLAFYCTKKGCEVSICTACTVCDHEKSKGHTIINVQDIYTHKKSEMDEMFRTLEQDIGSARFILQQTEQEMLNMDIKELEIERDIENTFGKCRKYLDWRQKELKDRLDHMCEDKKGKVQKQVEALETYLDAAANAKDFSTHVLQHTDPTEFIPLHSTLQNRLKALTDMKVDRQTLSIEFPVFDPRLVETDFLRYARNMGQLGTMMQHKKLNISRGRTDIGLPSASSGRRQGEIDRRFGDITCPGFTFDAESVHQYREISDNRRVLRNYATVQRQPTIHGARRLKKYRGALSSRPLNAPGKHYYEVVVSYNIVKALDNINFVFEIGVSRRNDIDNGYYVYDQPQAWSFCGQHCDDHKMVCLWCRHNGRNLAHFTLSPSIEGTTVCKKYGFLLDTERGQYIVLDCSEGRKLYTFHGVDVSRPLWPVFGCHWPSKVKLDMKLVSGRDIEDIPELLSAT